MPTVTYNDQCFSIDGRRFWILAASIQYARIPGPCWEQRIRAVRHSGFNTIETAVPWNLHESRKGRYSFEGDTDLHRFISLCGEQGLKVILRAGPNIGSGFDGGGLPGWLIDEPDMAVREKGESFLEHLSKWFRKLIGVVADLQATDGGPILLVQSEHAWTCTNPAEANTYLHEVKRFLRESGIKVPLLNANDLWLESPGTIDTWRGYDDLLAHLRQLRTLQPETPRVVSCLEVAPLETWGSSQRNKLRKPAEQPGRSPDGMLRRVAEVLAAGAQPVIGSFHAGTNFGFLGGRLAGHGASGGFVATAASASPPLAEDGSPTEGSFTIRRLITFANHFGSVFADLDPEDQVAAVDPQLSEGNDGSPSIIPLRGALGRVVFVFGRVGGTTTILTSEGIRLPIELGDQSVGWYLMNVDLQGLGRLDYANVCPLAVIDRSVVVFFGAAGSHAFLSISGIPLELEVPADGAKPVVVSHAGLKVVLLSQHDVDATLIGEHEFLIGATGLDVAGALPHPDFPRGWKVTSARGLEPATFGETRTRKNTGNPRLPVLTAWQASPCTALITGESPRYATLEGPQPLSACGAPCGYGWYRLTWNQPGAGAAAGKRLAHLPQTHDRAHLFIEGKLTRLFGEGPGADPVPFEFKPPKSPAHLVALVDNLGRFCEGNDLQLKKGLSGHLLALKKLPSAKGKAGVAVPVDPFTIRGFISGRAVDQLSDSQQVIWTFQHTRKTPILVDVIHAEAHGTFVLNDQPIAYSAGRTGAEVHHLLLNDTLATPLKRGKNVLRFAPDAGQPDAVKEIIACTTLYEVEEEWSASASWSFAKWEPPTVANFRPIEKGETRSLRGVPCWWRGTFDGPSSSNESLRLDVASLSKGQAYVNGNNLGRYFSNTREGKAVGPQTTLWIPPAWLKPDATNEIVLFDEHGFDPAGVKIVR